MVTTEIFVLVIFKFFCLWNFFTWIYSALLSAAFDLLAENDGYSTVSDGLES